jgi:hypothetical protein
MGKKKKKKKKGVPKMRDPFALEAKMQTGGGYHRHPKWEESKNACRGKVDIEAEMEDELGPDEK